MKKKKIAAALAVALCAATAAAAAEGISKEASVRAWQEAMLASVAEEPYTAPLAGKEELGKTIQNEECKKNGCRQKEPSLSSGFGVAGTPLSAAKDTGSCADSDESRRKRDDYSRDMTCEKRPATDEQRNTRYEVRGTGYEARKATDEQRNTRYEVRGTGYEARKATDERRPTNCEVQFGAGYKREVIEAVVERAAQKGIEGYVAVAADKRGRTLYRARAAAANAAEARAIAAKLSRMGLKNFIAK